MYLDVLANDIAKVFGVHSLITHFPDQFKQAFVFDGSILADNVKPAAEPIVSSYDEWMSTSLELLKTFLYTADKKGESISYSYVYNNIVRTPISCITSYS